MEHLEAVQAVEGLWGGGVLAWFLSLSSVSVVCVLSVAFTVLRYSVQGALQVVLSGTLASPSLRVKFSESSWKLLYYSAVWLWALSLVLRQDFFWTTRLCWVGWPSVPISPAFRLYYLTQLAFYVHSLVAHLTIEVRRGDFVQMLLHHIVTCMLIGASYAVGFHRIGGVLLALHDVNDILLELAKQLKYLEWHKVSNAVFGITLLTWGITRVVLFPIKVAYSSNYESWELIGDVPGWYVFNALILVIQALNLYWFSLMLQMLHRVIFKNEQIRDTREKDE